MASEYRTRRRVEFEDTDAAGIVHFSRFHVFMEQAEHAFLRSLGLSVHMDFEGDRVSWPRMASSCEFYAAARFEEEIDIHLRVARLSARSVTYACAFWRGEEKLASGEISSACCICNPGEPMRSVEIPAIVAAQLEEAPPP